MGGSLREAKRIGGWLAKALQFIANETNNPPQRQVSGMRVDFVVCIQTLQVPLIPRAHKSRNSGIKVSGVDSLLVKLN